jgi:very-short-patch-repair endonuclease
VHWRQLRECGISQAKISRWLADGYLHLVHPRVYAVGHTAASREAELVAAVLYAGPGAMLSHETAAWWWGLTDRPPRAIHVSTPRRCRSLRGRGPAAVRVHARRDLDRVWYRRLPITNIPQTLLDFASIASYRRVRYALAEAEYHELLDLEAIEEVVGRGRPGSDVLIQAVANHQPQLAHTRSEFERRFIELCEWGRLPVPEFNVPLVGLTVDALWREQRVVVELDGRRGHGTAAQIARDRERDLRLRAAGYAVLRYTWGQVAGRRALIVADVRRALGIP